MIPLENAVVTDLINLPTVDLPQGHTVHVVNRFSYALSFCMSGRITYTHQEQSVISDREHAVFLPQGASYSLHCDRSGDFPVINFYCRNKLCDTVERVYIGNPEPYIAEHKRMTKLSLFEENRALLMSIFYGMLHRIRSTSKTDAVLKPAIQYIETCFTDRSIRNARLAWLCGVSEVYFRTLFPERSGITPRQYIIDVRINRARQLLCEGKLRMSEISEACGFTDPYHFYHMFKQKTGITPSEYKKRNQTDTI